MKNYKAFFYMVVLSGTLLVSGCKKIIEIEPEFVKDGATIFTTLQDYEWSLNGTYATFRFTGYYGSGGQTTSSWAALPDMMGDNLVQTTEDLANWQNQSNWVYSATESDVAVAWGAVWGVISQANLTLRDIEQFSTSDPKAVNRVKGQALAIRAIGHFDALRFWAQSYDRNSAELGIPYVKEVNKDIKPSRLTVKQSWDEILKDMLEAETLLGDIDKAINSSTNKAAIDRTVVRAMLARMYLYAKDYVNAENYASLAITALPLASKTAFPAMWNSTGLAEVFWEIVFANPSEGSPSAGVHIASSNRNRFRPATSLTGLYDVVNDIRVPVYLASRASGTVSAANPRPLLPFTGTGSNARKIVGKYMSRGTTLDNVVNWKVLRTGEMYLIRAEARAMQGGAKEALGLQDLNDLRAARINGYVPVVLTGQALLDAIMTERRKELFSEGHRWFDLRRTTKSIVRTEADLASTRLTLTPDRREWIWPIPQGEMDANPNMKQNPNY